LITEALNWLEYTQGFNFASLSVDANKRIRGLNFFYAGGSDSAWSKGLWPHMGWLNNQFCADGVCTGYYQITNMGNSLAIGTFSHETGHLVMGWPDLYDYDGSSEGSAASYCIMGFGSIGAQSQYRPVPPNGFFRYQVGWDTVTELNPALNANAPKGRLSHTSGSHALYRWTWRRSTRRTRTCTSSVPDWRFGTSTQPATTPTSGIPMCRWSTPTAAAILSTT
jgi:M6 family metalloprotease-like protein